MINKYHSNTPYYCPNVAIVQVSNVATVMMWINFKDVVDIVVFFLSDGLILEDIMLKTYNQKHT